MVTKLLNFLKKKAHVIQKKVVFKFSLLLMPNTDSLKP